MPYALFIIVKIIFFLTVGNRHDFRHSVWKWFVLVTVLEITYASYLFI